MQYNVSFSHKEMRIRKTLLYNPSEPLIAAHLPLHKGGFWCAADRQSLHLNAVILFNKVYHTNSKVFTVLYLVLHKKVMVFSKVNVSIFPLLRYGPML